MGYKHRQTGYVILAMIIPALALLIVLYLQGPIEGFEKDILFYSIILMVLITLVFSSLTVQVNEEEIVWYFGPGIWKFRIKLANVQQVYKGRSHPLEGIGIRWNPWKGMLYNVSGLWVVEILRKDGRLTRIGTDEPDKLIRAIRERLKKDL